MSKVTRLTIISPFAFGAFPWSGLRYDTVIEVMTADDPHGFVQWLK